MRWFSNFILRHAILVSICGSLLGILGGYYSTKLYKNLKTDIRELLPPTARSVLDFHEVSKRLESIDTLSVLLFSKNTGQSKKFVNDLAQSLKSVSKDIIASVDYKIGEELLFFKKKQALFLEVTDLLDIQHYIEDRINYEETLYNPLTIFSEEEIREPKFNFAALIHKYQEKAATVANYEKLPQGYFATADETKRVLRINLPGQSAGIEGAHRLKQTIETKIRALNPKSYAYDLVIRYTGSVEDMIEEQEALVEDLEISTCIVMLLVSIAMLLFYRNVRATLALIASLLVGTLCTFGIAYPLIGYLNVNSAFLGSIIIGNGINFGIIYLARYLEERRMSHCHLKSTHIAMTQTATSTWTAALAAGLSYGSLMLTQFRGFNQFGLIGLIGMIFCWICAYTLLPAYLSVFEKFKKLVKPQEKNNDGKIAGSIAFFVKKAPRFIWTFSFLATLLSLGSLYKLNGSILETDLSKLRNKDSIKNGSAYLSQYLDEIFNHYLSPLVILPSSKENSEKIAALLIAQKAREGEKSLIATVQTIDDFIPKNQEQKIHILKKIKDLLPTKIKARLSKKDRALIDQFLKPEAFLPFSEKDLPPIVLEKFSEKNGNVGKLILVEPPLTNVTKEADRLIAFVENLRNTADSVEKEAAIAGTIAITSDMIQAISTDGPRATLFAFFSVIILVIFLFKNIRTIGLVLFSLFLGVIWLAGIIIVFDLKINLLNFIALPITFGIGVDYGVNIFQRYKETKGKNILNVIKTTGGAVGLSSFSTTVGYASLLIARNQGFISFGTIAVLGELTCFIAAVISLPAYLITKQNLLSTKT